MCAAFRSCPSGTDVVQIFGVGVWQPFVVDNYEFLCVQEKFVFLIAAQPALVELHVVQDGF